MRFESGGSGITSCTNYWVQWTYRASTQSTSFSLLRFIDSALFHNEEVEGTAVLMRMDVGPDLLSNIPNCSCTPFHTFHQYFYFALWKVFLNEYLGKGWAGARESEMVICSVRSVVTNKHGTVACDLFGPLGSIGEKGQGNELKINLKWTKSRRPRKGNINWW